MRIWSFSKPVMLSLATLFVLNDIIYEASFWFLVFSSLDNRIINQRIFRSLNKQISIIVAHFDDEVVFFAPFFQNNEEHFFDENIYKKKLFCLTCKSNKVRRSEFIEITKLLGCSHKQFDLPIVRGLAANYFKDTNHLLKPIIKKSNISVTHSLFGDDHFHPQHSIISLVCFINCIRYKTKMIVSKSQKNFFLVLLSAFSRTNYKSFKSILFLPLKITLILFDYIFF